MVEFQLIDGGYEIYVDGVKMIHQPHSPTRGVEVSLTKAQSERLAKLVCRKLEMGADAIVGGEEEKEMLTNTSEGRIQEMALTAFEKEKQAKGNMKASQDRLMALEEEIQELRGEVARLKKGES